MAGAIPDRRDRRRRRGAQARDCKSSPPDAEAGPLPLPGIHPELPGHPDHLADGQRGRRDGGPAGRRGRRQGAGPPVAVPVGPAVPQLHALHHPAGPDAGPAAGVLAPVPGFGNGRADRGGHRPAPAAAPADDAGGARGPPGGDLFAVAWPWALRTAHQMLDHANRSLVVSGLDAGKFTVLSSGAVVYVSALSPTVPG